MIHSPNSIKVYFVIQFQDQRSMSKYILMDGIIMHTGSLIIIIGCIYAGGQNIKVAFPEQKCRRALYYEHVP